MSHLEALAKDPRPVGSPANARAREYCAAHLRSLGFTTVERPFEFSALPGRGGPSIIGGLGALLMMAASWFGARGRAVESTVLVFAAIVATVVLARWFGGPAGTKSRFMRESGINLEATRGANPRVWLVAHVDSKSQPVSTAVRTVGVVLLSAAMVEGLVLAIIHLSLIAPAEAWWAVGAAAFAGGIPLVASTIGANSAGAADNASGVAAVLGAAEGVGAGKEFGILITDAEEIALAGARDWVIGREPAIAINCDTIDDDGRFVVMRYAGRLEPVTGRAAAAARKADPRALVIRPLPAVLTDSVAFRQAGWTTVTLSRGTLRTLNRIHTRRDTLDSIRGTGIPAAAHTLARLVEELA